MLTSLLIKQKTLEAGFDLVGISPANMFNANPKGSHGDLQFAREWWEKGFGGKMNYLANPKREDPRRVLPNVRSVISVGLVYNTPFPRSGDVNSDEVPRGWISRYAWGEDYHRILKRKLDSLCRVLREIAPKVKLIPCIDTGPIVERAFGRFSGIGWMGKNTCLIDTKRGSWFFLGVVLTDLDLTPDTPAPDRCGSCTKCLEACPTGAFIAPYVMDSSRCISYFTIELRGTIPESFRESMTNHIFGCDICQDVCPWNRRVDTTSEDGFLPLPLTSNTKFPGEHETLFHPRLETLASLSEPEFNKLFSLSPLKRTKYLGWLRNLTIAMGNSANAKFIPWLEEQAEKTNKNAILREHAQWAVSKLRKVFQKA